MKIDANIRRAVQLAVDKLGSQAAVGRACELHWTTINKYTREITHAIGDDSWAKLFPVLREFLPDGYGPGGGAPAGAADPGAIHLSDEEQRLVAMYRAASPADRRRVEHEAEQAFIKGTLGASKSA